MRRIEFGTVVPVWRDEASCAAATKSDPLLASAWIVDQTSLNPMEDEAKEICRECPVRMQCLKDALSDSQAQGIRAGFHFETGRLREAEMTAIRTEMKIRVPYQKRLYAERDRARAEAV